MVSEKKKGLKRISANYGRLVATMIMGIITVPLQVKWLGIEGFGLIGLVGSSVGLGMMFQDMMRSSMVRELGAAWHKNDERAFRSAYAASFQTSIGVMLITALFFTGIIFILPYMNIKETWIAPAQWITMCEGLATCIIVLASPSVSMLVVRECFFWHNLWTVLRRSAYLIATVIPFLILKEPDITKGLYQYGTIVFIINASVTILVVIGFALMDKQMTPTCKGSTKDSLKKVVSTFGWNSGVVVAMNLHERIANFIMNLFFGLWGNAIFSLALRLVSYIRMTTLGLTFGLDAVSARISSTKNSESMKNMFRHSTRMLGFIAFPAMIIVFVFVEPLLRMWVGRSVSDPATMLPPTEILVKIMVIGLTCRAVSDGWMKLFYGAGHINKYAPYVFAGGLFNPLLAILFIYALPDSANYTGAAIAYSIVFLVVHAIIMPAVTAHCINMTFKEITIPSIRPLIIAIAASPCLFINSVIYDSIQIGWIQILIAVGLFGVVYVGLSLKLLLSTDERSRIISIVKRISNHQED